MALPKTPHLFRGYSDPVINLVEGETTDNDKTPVASDLNTVTTKKDLVVLIKSKDAKISFSDLKNLKLNEVYKRVVYNSKETDYILCIKCCEQEPLLYSWQTSSGTGTVRKHPCFVKMAAQQQRERSSSVPAYIDRQSSPPSPSSSIASKLSGIQINQTCSKCCFTKLTGLQVIKLK